MPMFDQTNTALPQTRGGKVRALALTSALGMPQFPGVPTVAQSAVPGFQASTWYGLYAPGHAAAGDRDAVCRLAASIGGQGLHGQDERTGHTAAGSAQYAPAALQAFTAEEVKALDRRHRAGAHPRGNSAIRRPPAVVLILPRVIQRTSTPRTSSPASPTRCSSSATTIRRISSCAAPGPDAESRPAARNATVAAADQQPAQRAGPPADLPGYRRRACLRATGHGRARAQRGRAPTPTLQSASADRGVALRATAGRSIPCAHPSFASPLGARMTTRDNTPANPCSVELVEGDGRHLTVAAKGKERRCEGPLHHAESQRFVVADWIIAQLPGCPGRAGVRPTSLGAQWASARRKQGHIHRQARAVRAHRHRSAAEGPRRRTAAEALRTGTATTRINALGIGAQGLGETWRCWTSKSRKAPTHAALQAVA